MHKLWSLLFLPVPLLCVALCVVAPSHDWWLPENISTFGGKVDHLFNVILAIVTVAFLGTQAALVYVLFRYAGTGQRAWYLHTNHRLEMSWTIVPAVILLFIAIYQFKTWTEIKVKANFPKEEDSVTAEVLAGQFEWRIRYPGNDGKIGSLDDIISLNDLHVPVNTNMVIQLRSRDVLHSFFLPNLRVKQDAVPGMSIPVWFKATKEGEYDLTCAELCGWGHYKMRGKLTVQSQAAFDEWIKNKYAEQEADREVSE